MGSSLYFILITTLLALTANVSAQRELGGDCTPTEVSPGKYSFDCNKVASDLGDALTFGSEHILWIEQPSGQKLDIDVEIPNYKIDELIKAGFKGGKSGNTRVNVLLRRPVHTYDAEVADSPVSNNVPSVGIKYEPVEKLLVHYPVDKPYRPTTAPIVEPYQPQEDVDSDFITPSPPPPPEPQGYVYTPPLPGKRRLVRRVVRRRPATPVAVAPLAPQPQYDVDF